MLLLTARTFGSTVAEFMTLILPLLLYSHIRVLEEGRSTMHMIRSLVNLRMRKENIERVKIMRQKLVEPAQVSFRSVPTAQQGHSNLYRHW